MHKQIAKRSSHFRFSLLSHRPSAPRNRFCFSNLLAKARPHFADKNACLLRACLLIRSIQIWSPISIGLCWYSLSGLMPCLRLVGGGGVWAALVVALAWWSVPGHPACAHHGPSLMLRLGWGQLRYLDDFMWLIHCDCWSSIPWSQCQRRFPRGIFRKYCIGCSLVRSHVHSWHDHTGDNWNVFQVWFAELDIRKSFQYKSRECGMCEMLAAVQHLHDQHCEIDCVDKHFLVVCYFMTII